MTTLADLEFVHLLFVRDDFSFSFLRLRRMQSVGLIVVLDAFFYEWHL